MIDQQQIAEWRMDRSSYVPEYLTDNKAEVQKLRNAATEAQFEGDWFIIGDKGYNEARAQYASTSREERDVSPGIILYPAKGKIKGLADIKKAVAMCTRLGISIAIRTGGHQYCGFSSTSSTNMQIDLSACFPEYDYDEEKNELTCGVSHALGDWATLNNEHNIYLPMGVCSNVHLGGHVHTGGWGIVGRSHGLLADHVLHFDIILASGEQKTVYRPVREGTNQTDETNNELFYAVLGGGKGGDFGIVTHLTFSPLVNDHYPNSACYNLTWVWTKERMEKVATKMYEYSKLCADGTIPGDYEFMLTITGTGTMNFLPTLVATGFQELDESGRKELFNEIESAILSKFEKYGIELDLVMPPFIQMWMCYTNKDGASKDFDPYWFDQFEEALGTPFGPMTHKRQKTPVSEGIVNQFIMHADREMEYPFIKRARVSMDVPDTFPQSYTERMWDIMNVADLPLGTDIRQHLCSQMQIYAGGKIAENGKLGNTSYSWRDQALSISHDSFYDVTGWFWSARKDAIEWQRENDQAFIADKNFADKDMRMFAYTFGNPVLKDVWPYYFDSLGKYYRLKGIKAKLDPSGLFSADKFSLDVE